MRLTNRRRIPIYNFILTSLIIFSIACVSLYVVEKYKLDFLGKENILLLIIPVLCFIFFWIKGNQVFEYDSDGEALNFNNFNVVPFFKNAKRDEFPKYKLIKYEVLNLFFIKRLYITISSKKTHSLILKYDISYLSDKDIKDLKFSLQKVVKYNTENPNISDFN
ncbi:hypothetical protein [Chryseobacterium sp. T1]